MSDHRNSDLEALASIEPLVAEVIATHRSQQRLWYPSELIPEGFTPPELPPFLSAALTLNLLTEDGLPFFFGLLVSHLGDEGPWFEWTRLWTAEEDRHGAVIKHYLAKALRRDQMVRVEALQYQYLNTGFWPHWSKDPFQLLAYVVLQEKATAQSHGTIARLAMNVDPTLTKIMGKITGEENKHHQVYFTLLSALYQINPTRVIESLNLVSRRFAMPGASVPGFHALSEVQARAQIFGPEHLATIIKDVTDRLGVWSEQNISPAGEKARDTLDRTTQVYRSIGEKIRAAKPTALPIGFLGADVSVTL